MKIKPTSKLNEISTTRKKKPLTRHLTGSRLITLISGIDWFELAPIIFLTIVLIGFFIIIGIKVEEPSSWEAESAQEIEQEELPVEEEISQEYKVDDIIITTLLRDERLQLVRIYGSEYTRNYEIYTNDEAVAREAAEYIKGVWEEERVITINVLVLVDDDTVDYVITEDCE